MAIQKQTEDIFYLMQNCRRGTFAASCDLGDIEMLYTVTRKPPVVSPVVLGFYYKVYFARAYKFNTFAIPFRFDDPDFLSYIDILVLGGHFDHILIARNKQKLYYFRASESD